MFLSCQGGGLYMEPSSTASFRGTTICQNQPHNVHVESGAKFDFPRYVAAAGDFDGTMTFHADLCGTALR